MGLLDALDYAGSIADKFGGRAVRGLLVGKPRELLSPIPFSDTLGITDPSQVTRGHELVSKLGLVREDDPFGQAALGLGAEIATDPLTYLGGFGAHRAMTRALPEAAGASHFGALKGLREPSALLKGLGGPMGGGRITGMRQARAAVPGADDLLRAAGTEMFRQAPAGGRMISPWAGGGLEPFRNFGYSLRPQSDRQELMHAMIKNAAIMGGEEEFGPVARMAVRQYRKGGFQPTGFHMGLADVLDEIASNAAESRGTLGQLKGGLGFALSPEQHGLYHGQFAGKSPLAAGLFHAAPGAIPGALGGASLGGEQGYEHGGVGGGLVGALSGGLAGAALGGGLSHLAYAPRAAAGVGGALGGESAARILKGYEKVMPFLERKGTPINRFKRLADSVGADFVVPRTADELAQYLGGNKPADVSGLYAAYNPYTKTVAPNVEHFPTMWSDPKLMSRMMEQHFGTRHLSTPLADALGLHEIAHRLHHGRDINNFDFFSDVNNLTGPQMAGAGHGAKTAHELWQEALPRMARQVSRYATKEPSEYVAESFPKMVHRAIGANLPGEMRTSGDPLYRALKGPNIPSSLMNELDRMYGGDLGRALRGESASLGLKYDVPAEEAVARRGQTVPFGPEHAIEPRVITPESLGLLRSDPEWINNRTFYHGTGSAGLSPESLDIQKTDPMSLVGRGIYTTDEAGSPDLGVTKGYGEARAMELETQIRRAAAGSGSARALESLRKMADRRPDLLSKLLADDPLYQAAKGTGDVQFSFKPPGMASDPRADDLFLSDLFQKLEEKHQERALGRIVKPNPRIYQAQSDFGRILDLDRPNAELARALAAHPRWDFQLAKGDTTNPIYDVFQTVRSGIPGESDALTEYLRQHHGYDALTHTGGGRWGGASESPHQVVVGLNPQKYRRFEELPRDELARIFGQP